MTARPRVAVTTFVTLGLLAASCAGERPSLDASQILPSSTTTSTTTTTTTVTTTVAPEPGVLDGSPAPDGRRYPGIPTDARDIGARLVEVEWLVRGTPLDDPDFPDLAHEQQVLYRHIGRHPEWLPEIWDLIPGTLAESIELQILARQSIAGIPHGDPPVNVPAWRIIEPLPADELLALYEQAGNETGIHWSYLAAINFIETGFGRIAGVSTAGAQGPMQFLPTTWEEVSDGDINDPFDAIPAAALYLVRRGGPEDMERALWGYNNSDSYVDAVTAYADLFRIDIASYYAAHAWEIHYSAAAGDLWLPVGYLRTESTPVEQYLDEAPWSAPPPASSP